ncbi:YciI family protein [Sphaerisporangium sp. B11E5]|uniref:YciI family protein n=1 Tax=Sphaerisporangium sp. B11E5 TaxID=3153563 RepID=UPI00325DB93B
MSYFFYKFTSRPDFVETMTEAEAAVMSEHAAYWRVLADKGIAIAVGPVADPAGTFGAGILEVASLEEAEAIRAGDPVVTAGLGPVQIHPMLSAITRPWRPGPD